MSTHRAQLWTSLLERAPVYVDSAPPAWAALHSAVQAMFGHQLEELHSWPYMRAPVCQDVTRATDQASPAHAQFYRLYPRMAQLWRAVALELGDYYMDVDYYVQAAPTFRVHFPLSRSIGEPLTEWNVGHQLEEVTVWLPLTVARESSTLWVADRLQGWDRHAYTRTLRDRGTEAADATLPPPVSLWPVNLEPGQLLVYDAAARLHAELLNHTGRTRVSLDWRYLPVAAYDPENRRQSVASRLPMRLGGYWADPEEWRRELGLSAQPAQLVGASS